MSKNIANTLWFAEPHTLAKISILRAYLSRWFEILGRSVGTLSAPARSSIRFGAWAPHGDAVERSRMSSVALEAYLARLYTDIDAREAFLAYPERAARAEGISDTDAAALRDIDRVGLRMAAESYAHKRAQHRRPKKGLYQMLRDWLAKH